MPKITNYGELRNDPKKKRMDLLLQLLLNGKPFNLFDDPAFIQLTAAENTKLNINLNSNLIRDHLNTTFSKMNSKIVELLKGKYLCLKFDCASRSYRQFLCLSAQFIDNSKLKNVTLGFIELFGRHTAENLSNWINDILKNFEIQPRQVIAATTDTASNMIAATKKLAEKMLEEDKIDQDFFYSSINELKTEDEINNNLVGAICHEIGHIKCGSHVVQLCVTDFFANDNPVLIKARSVIKYLRRPTNLNTIRLQGMNLPPLDNETR